MFNHKFSFEKYFTCHCTIIVGHAHSTSIFAVHVLPIV
jgi:hypothetical protein